MDVEMNKHNNMLEHYIVAVVIPRRYTIHNISMHCYCIGLRIHILWLLQSTSILHIKISTALYAYTTLEVHTLYIILLINTNNFEGFNFVGGACKTSGLD